MCQKAGFVFTVTIVLLLSGITSSAKTTSDTSAISSSQTTSAEKNSAKNETKQEPRTNRVMGVPTEDLEAITLLEPPLDEELLKQQVVVFSDDGLHVGWTLPTTDGRWVVTMDGQTGPAYDQIKHIALSHDGTRFAYTAKTGEEWFTVIDGEESPAYDGISIDSPTFNPDGLNVAYGAMKDNKWFLVLNGLSLGYECEDIGPVLFSPDGRHIVHTALKDGRWTVMIDGAMKSDYEHIYKLNPTADAVEYMADRDGWFFRCRRSYPSTDAENQGPHGGNLTEKKLYRSRPQPKVESHAANIDSGT